MNEQLLSWQIQCVQPTMRRGRKVSGMEAPPWGLCVSWGDGKGMQGRCGRDDARSGGAGDSSTGTEELRQVAEEGRPCVIGRGD